MAAVGRGLLFLVLFVAALVAVQGLLLAPLEWLLARSGQRLRLDWWLQLVAALLATAAMVRSVDRREWSTLGLGRDAARARVLGAGALLGLAAIGLPCLVLFGGGWMRFASAPEGAWAGAALRVTLVLLPAAVTEELLCRGYLFTVARDALGERGAVAGTSVLFGALHLWNQGVGNEQMVLVTLAGILLASVRVATESVWAAAVAHFVWNWIMAVPLHAAVSGIRFESPGYRAVDTGPTWWTGGAWGPEGGLAAGLGMLVVLTYLYARRLGREDA